MHRTLLFLLLTLAARSAAATPPIDGDGRFQHVVTLRPLRMAQPLPLQGPVRMFASAQAADGSLLLIGDGEYLLIDPKGKLDRVPFDKAMPAYPTFGLAVLQKDNAQKDVLYYCDQQGKALRKMSDFGSKLTVIASNLDLGNACQVFADGHNGFSLCKAGPFSAGMSTPKAKSVKNSPWNFPCANKALRPNLADRNRAVARLPRCATAKAPTSRLCAWTAISYRKRRYGS